MKQRDTTYEVWWKGADGRWRLAKEFIRQDRMIEYLRSFIERYPGVHVRAHKKWVIRHKVFEFKSAEIPHGFPVITVTEQLDIYETTTTNNRAKDSESAVPTERIPGSPEGHRQQYEEGNDNDTSGSGGGNLDSKEPA